MKQLLLVLVGITTLLGGCKTTSPKVDPNVIAQKYCDSLKTGDYETFRSLFRRGDEIFNKDRTTQEVFIKWSKFVFDLEILSASIPYVELTFKTQQGGLQRYQTLYLFENGEIFSDPFFVGNRARTDVSCYKRLMDEEEENRNNSFIILTNNKVPLYGYEVNASNDERKIAVTQIQNWLADNLASYEPIPPSETDLRKLEHNLRLPIKRNQ